MSTQAYRADALYGRTVYASDGEKLGKVEDVLVDDGGAPVFIETKKGLFSGKRHVIPVSGMAVADEDLTVGYTRQQLEDAPAFDPDDDIDYERERTLGAHYGTEVREWDERRDPLAGEDLSRGPTPQTRHPGGGLDDVRDTTQGPTPETRRAIRADEGLDAHAAGQPNADPTTRGEGGGTQDARSESPAATETEGDSMTRSEEELTVGTHRESAGRVRLRKWVDTERVDENVSLEREEARVTREPIAEGEGGEQTIGERQVELELTEEVADVDKRIVGKERVSLGKETVSEDRTVSEELRKERVEVSGDVEPGETDTATRS